jgi:DNA-binding MarR family transcriptional regulator
MDQKYLLIKDLIDKVAEYEQHTKGKELHLEGFAAYLRPKTEHFSNKRELSGPKEKKMQERGERQETSIAILVTFVHRYSKLYARKIFQNSVISSLDDFSYLIVLLTHESLSKTELIRKNVHEKASGMEIIRRLVKDKLMKQVDDKEDKRSKRLSITAAGKAAVFGVLKQLEEMGNLMAGNLSEHEKHELQCILRKLDNFHYDIYLHDRELSVGEILEKRLH